jgi:penicillin-binding protein 1C
MKKPSQKWKIVRRIGFFVLVLGFIGFVATAVSALVLIRNLPNPERISERAVAESTKIYDRTGKILLYDIHGEEKRTIVPFDQIPSGLIRATLAAEDIRFYQHSGIDFRGIARAVFGYVRNRETGPGGSTITQQLVKKALLSDERTIPRKIREAALAILLERKYSKDEVLGMYLNQIPYGSNAYGISAAAQTFFGKQASELTLVEAATLAALPNAPTRLSPYGSHLDELVARRNWILDRMAEAGFADKEDVDGAKNTAISVVPPRQGLLAPHFVMYVREYLQEKYGEDAVEQSGFKVITTLDMEFQNAAEKIIKDGADLNEKQAGAANAAAVAIDPKTGEILAMVGSADYWTTPKPDKCRPGINCRLDPHVNIATRSRQPGSSFKPFVYATAFKKGFTPETVLFDVFTEFNTYCNADGNPGSYATDATRCYHPQDYDGSFRGPVTLRQALAQSLNVPAVKLLYLSRIKDSIATAQSMGISTLTDPDRYGLSLVLGGAEVTLLDMTSAYGVFSQDGMLHPKTAILRIEDPRGAVLEEKKDSNTPVIDTEVSRTINDILSDNNARVPVFSPTSSLYFPNRRIAAKTGTTQDYRDAWTVGYTPSIAIGVWVGNSDNTAMRHSAASVMVAAPIWHKLMAYALEKIPPEDFIAPEKKDPEKAVFRGMYRGGPFIKIDSVSKKLATAYTPPELVQEVGLGPVQSILGLINKDDPLGPAPASPGQDQQYGNWQAGIDVWAASHGIPAANAPSEVDDVHMPEKTPQVSLILPDPDPNNLKNIAAIMVSVAAAFPLREVSLFINDTLIDSKTAPIVTQQLTFPLTTLLAPGNYTIKITAYDAMRNTKTLEQTITVVE